jgi:D-lactate dehydrogenase
MTKLAFFEVDEQEQAVLRDAFAHESRFDIEVHQEPLTAQNAQRARDAEGIGIFIRSHITREVLDQMEKLSLIAAMSTGVDHIDLDACRERNIAVCNVPSYGDNTVAEYAFGLILALARNFRPIFRRVDRGEFSRAGLRGTDLKGKTLGLIGTGRIGSHLARLAWAADMKVIAYDLHPNPNLTMQYGVDYLSLEDVLQQSDVISLHVPYAKSTHHLINAERLQMVRHTAFLINTSRGQVVDTEAVADALREGRLGGVALDTFEGEQVWIEEEFLKRDDIAAIVLREAMESFSILQSDRAILTPHNAYNTDEALKRILTTSSDNIKAFFAGHPQNVVAETYRKPEERKATAPAR